MTPKTDAIYAAPLQKMIDFQFDERVVAVFPDMIQRSVPGYGMIISNIGILAAKYAQAGSHCYDLGCSLGAASLAMRKTKGSSTGGRSVIPHPIATFLSHRKIEL